MESLGATQEFMFVHFEVRSHPEVQTKHVRPSCIATDALLGLYLGYAHPPPKCLCGVCAVSLTHSDSNCPIATARIGLYEVPVGLCDSVLGCGLCGRLCDRYLLYAQKTVELEILLQRKAHFQ